MKQAVPLLILVAAFAPGQDQRPTVRASTAGVLIDVTVLDKDGRAVMDLTAADFEITEDGKLQQIVSATAMRGGVPARIVGSNVNGATRPQCLGPPYKARDHQKPVTSCCNYQWLRARCRRIPTAIYIVAA
jgi:hypothetical protein